MNNIDSGSPAQNFNQSHELFDINEVLCQIFEYIGFPYLEKLKSVNKHWYNIISYLSLKKPTKTLEAKWFYIEKDIQRLNSTNNMISETNEIVFSYFSFLIPMGIRLFLIQSKDSVFLKIKSNFNSLATCYYPLFLLSQFQHHWYHQFSDQVLIVHATNLKTLALTNFIVDFTNFPNIQTTVKIPKENESTAQTTNGFGVLFKMISTDYLGCQLCKNTDICSQITFKNGNIDLNSFKNDAHSFVVFNIFDNRISENSICDMSFGEIWNHYFFNNGYIFLIFLSACIIHDFDHKVSFVFDIHKKWLQGEFIDSIFKIDENRFIVKSMTVSLSKNKPFFKYCFLKKHPTEFKWSLSVIQFENDFEHTDYEPIFCEFSQKLFFVPSNSSVGRVPLYNSLIDSF